MKHQLFLIILSLLITIPVQAFELDMSVDEDIRKNYNPSKLEYEVLPELPGVIKNSKNEKDKTVTTQPAGKVSDVPSKNIESSITKTSDNLKATDSFTEIKIRKGTKIKVQSQTKVSDWNTAGARMTFVSTAPVTKRYVSLPAGTVFKGFIEESHQPNYAGNGGLLKLKADNIILNGVPRNIDAKVIKADGKNIYFNNIKGKRGYIKGVGTNIKKGENFYQKTRQTSNKLASNPVGLIISPIPTIVGAAGYAGNLIISPISAIWSKGGHISIPAGKNYTLKLNDDFYLSK